MSTATDISTSAEEKTLAAAASSSAATTAPYTLRFTHWECGHHYQRPADIPVQTPEQALLILQAISHAISQPGSAHVALFDARSGTTAYVTDDYASVGCGPAETMPDCSTWPDRPIVIHGDEITLARIMAPGLKGARDDLFVTELEPWNEGKGQVWGWSVVTTTLTPEAIEQRIQDAADDSGGQPFELPPLYRDATEVLAELERNQAEFDAWEKEAREEAAA